MNVTLLLDNLRSTHNVGSLLRSADFFGIQRVVCAGYTPYPEIQGDTRLPHSIVKQTAAIHKTALGAEKNVEIQHFQTTQEAIDYYKKTHVIWALEQDHRSLPLSQIDVKAQRPIVLIVGNEVAGINDAILSQCQKVIEVPGWGKKESLNVCIATAIALYHMRSIYPQRSMQSPCVDDRASLCCNHH